MNHRCDNPACCNPAHMYLGSRADNMIDYWAELPPSDRKQHKRRTMFDAQQLERLWKMRREGATLRACAKEFGVHRVTVMRYITEVRRLRVEKLRAVRLSHDREKQI